MDRRTTVLLSLVYSVELETNSFCSPSPPEILLLRLYSIRNPPYNEYLYTPSHNALCVSRRPIPSPNTTILPIASF